MANTKGSALTTRGTPDRANDGIYVFNGGVSYQSTVNNELGISGAPVGTTDSQTLSAKTLTSPTITTPVINGTISGTYTLGGAPTFPASVVTLTGSQTLTNKTLTSPTITSPTITNASITADAVTGFTTGNSGTIYGVPVSAGLIAGSSVTNIPASSLGTGAITLGYAQITTTFSTASVTAVQVTGLTVTVTIPTGGRRVKITAFAEGLYASSANAYVALTIWDGVVNSGTQISKVTMNDVAGGQTRGATAIAVVSPAAGSKTYNVGLNTNTNTANLEAASTYPAFILVEAI